MCPYNKSHMILPARMQRHLILCRKDVLDKPTHPFHHQAKQMKTCPFNANHHINQVEMDRHLRNCASRLEAARAQIDEGPAPAWRSQIPQSQVVESTEDDWGDEADANPTEAYNPENKIMESDKPFLYNIQGKSKSEKRDYRASQRLKYATADQGASNNGWNDGWHDEAPQVPVGLNQTTNNQKKNKKKQQTNGWGDQSQGNQAGRNTIQNNGNNGWQDDWAEKTVNKPGLVWKRN